VEEEGPWLERDFEEREVFEVVQGKFLKRKLWPFS